MKEKVNQLEVYTALKGTEQQQEKLHKQIWDQYYSNLYYFCFYYVRSYGLEAEDLAQEVMMKVYSNLENYNPVYSLNTWVYRIAKNHCIDSLRKTTRRFECTKYEEHLSFNENNEIRYEPSAEFFNSQTERQVDEYLGKLPIVDRQISLLRFSQNLRYREIGRILEMPEGTIRFRVNQIRKGINLFLKEEGLND